MSEAKTKLILVLAGALCGVAGEAAAQNMNGGASQFNQGYGRNTTFNDAVNVATRDEDGNQVFINGRMDAPSGSVFARSSPAASRGGVGGAGVATAIGNNLVVVVEGSWNRVNVDSTQINNGDVSAQTSLNGRVNLE